MRRRRCACALATLLIGSLVAAWPLPGVAAQKKDYKPISGEGSSWAKGAIDDMAANVSQFGMTVNYNGSGSTNGRKSFIEGIVDFAASDIPFQFSPEDGSAPERVPIRYAYIPVTAGGTAFMYNLKINGKRVTNLRLSGENVAKIFTGIIGKWNDPAVLADNPGLVLPDRKIVPVVRSDGSGSTAQFTQWMISQHGGIWSDYCRRSGRAPACGPTSNYPTISGMIGQKGDEQVAGYVSSSFAEGAIGYANYSYAAIGTGFPVAKVLNAAGFYTEPTPENVAVSLLKAEINRDESNFAEYLTQKLAGVYNDSDPRNYPLSSYSYFILPTEVPDPGQGQFTVAKGQTLGDFAYYAMCQAQERSASNGYSPMPINLVQASFEQIRKIPGVVVQDIDISKCKNPTFSPDGTNLLAKNAPMPQECDKPGQTQCATGTGGAKSTPTAVSAGGGTQAPGASTSGGAPSPGGAGGGASTSGGATGASGAGGSSSGSASGGSSGDATAAAACDPDTGICGDGAGDLQAAANRTEVGGTGERAVASSTVLGGSSGRAGYAILIALVLLLTVALIFLPAAAWQHFSKDVRT